MSTMHTIKVTIDVDNIDESKIDLSQLETADEDCEGTANSIAYAFPSKKEVCSRCNGEGRHVNPNIDGNGITASEWDEWDEEDRDHYMNGVYDVTCEECHGANVVTVIDVETIESSSEECRLMYGFYCAQLEAQSQSSEDGYWDRLYSSMERGY